MIITVLIVQLSDPADVEVHHGLLDMLRQVVSKPCAVVGNTKLRLRSLHKLLLIMFLLPAI